MKIFVFAVFFTLFSCVHQDAAQQPPVSVEPVPFVDGNEASQLHLLKGSEWRGVCLAAAGRARAKSRRRVDYAFDGSQLVVFHRSFKDKSCRKLERTFRATFNCETDPHYSGSTAKKENFSHCKVVKEETSLDESQWTAKDPNPLFSFHARVASLPKNKLQLITVQNGDSLKADKETLTKKQQQKKRQ